MTKVNKLVNVDSKPLIANFFSLGFIQGSNFLLSVLTFPYIIRTVGVENFGLVTLLQAVMFYFTVLTDYGFNLSATKDISIQRNNKALVSAIFSEVITTKTFLLIISFTLLVTVVFCIPDIRPYVTLIVLSFAIVVGQLLLPTWFFQGIEKMKYITYINIISRALYAAGIFIFIKNADDFIYINLINGASAAVGGVISLVIVKRKFGLVFALSSLKQVKQQLANGWNIFFSNATVTVANNTNILILGVFATPVVLGYYSIAEKVFIIIRSFASILHQVVYPRVCVLANKSLPEFKMFLRKILIVVLVSFLPMSVALFFLSDYIINLVAGEYLSEASLVLRIIAFGPLLAALSIPVSQTMLAFHLSRNYAVIVGIGAFANVLLNFFLAYYFTAVGTACCILITEILVAGMLYASLYKFYPQYFFLSKVESLVELKVK